LTNYCGVGFQYCDSLDAFQRHAITKTNYAYRGFAQSHCSSASAQVTAKHPDVFRTQLLLRETVSPRQVRALSWTSNSSKWFYDGWIQNTTGNFAGLAAFGWN
jgi:hypothetical protein